MSTIEAESSTREETTEEPFRTYTTTYPKGVVLPSSIDGKSFKLKAPITFEVKMFRVGEGCEFEVNAEGDTNAVRGQKLNSVFTTILLNLAERRLLLEDPERIASDFHSLLLNAIEVQ